MSYILEALRRAESERERKRGGVPGLHANPVPMPSPEDSGERRGRPWTWVAGGLTIGVLLMILWRWWSVEPLVDEAALARAPVGGSVSPGDGGSAGAVQSAPAPQPSPAPAPAAPVPPAAATPAPAPAPKASVAAPEEPTRVRKPATPPRSTATAVASPRNPPPAPPPKPQAAEPKTAPTPAPATQPAAPAAQPAAPGTTLARNAAPAPAPERLRTLAELPEDLRRSVPQLAFGGSVYSDTPAQRMVIFNGQVMREGDAVNEELQIEQIRPRSAVLRMRGQRFEMPF